MLPIFLIFFGLPPESTHFQMDPQQFFGTDEPRRGTIAMRIKKNSSLLRGAGSPLLGLVGFVPYQQNDGYDGVCIQWLSDEEETMGGPSIALMVMDVRWCLPIACCQSSLFVKSLHQAFYCRDEAFEGLENEWMTFAFIWFVFAISRVGA